jgi:hypothetical protein
MIKIKIAHQQQANKPIFLLRTGAIECGNFQYDGRYKEKFKFLFEKIAGLAHTKPIDGVLDVSLYKYWDAIRIYDDYVLAKWLKSIRSFCQMLCMEDLRRRPCEPPLVDRL